MTVAITRPGPPDTAPAPAPDTAPAAYPCGDVIPDTNGRACEVTTGPDARHPGHHEHLDMGDDGPVLWQWRNHLPGLRRGSTPDRRVTRDDGTTSTVITMKRSCNRCHNRLGDATPGEIAAGISGERLPDVTGQCPTCTPA